MAVYDLGGEALNAVYDINGADLNTAFDLYGSEVYTGIEPVSLDQVSEIFQSSCVDAVTYVNSLPDGYFNYIVLADTHWESNWRHSAMICNYLYGTGKFDKFIHLGDMVSDDNVNEDGWNAMVEDGYLYYPNRCLFAAGNHDNHLSPLSTAEDYLLPLTVHHATDYTYHSPYYWDNTKAKIRFLVIHHGSNFNTDEAINWIHYRPTGYKWALLEHYPWNNGEWSEDMCNADGNWMHDLIDAESGFIGNFCGHLHLDSLDYLQTPNGTGYYQMVFDDDTKSPYSDDINGQTITIMSINPTTENVKFYRIGRNEVFDSNQWEYTGFTQ